MIDIVGIDPGKTGGLASLIVDIDGSIISSEAIVMPLQTDGRADIRLVRQYCQTTDIVVIEQQKARRMQGVNRAGVMMEEYGRLLGCLCGLDIHLFEVMPKTWQSVLGIEPNGHTKNQSIQRVQRLLPELNLKRSPRCKIYHDGMADAVNLALYGSVCFKYTTATSTR